MSTKLTKKNILISGGTSGLGAKTAEHFVSKGHSVAVLARNETALHAKVNELRNNANRYQEILGFACDVSNESNLSEIIQSIRERSFEVDVLICNAGVIGPIDKFEDSDSLAWSAAFEINLYGTVNLVRHTLPLMLERKSGKIIHVSGGGATAPLYGMTSYAASKAAAVRFIETLALENPNSGVQLNSIAPGMLKTQLLDQMLEAGPERIGSNLYSKSSAKKKADSDTTELAIRLIDFLASDSSNGITGKLISAEWDDWSTWPSHLEELQSSDVYTLRRIVGRDRGHSWGDVQ